ncbi:MAG: hypothetical protein KDD45_17570 [Bdellovibrionales bacterium]|nr:hypothetical protein [Bdellovibrionales bacterium]
MKINNPRFDRAKIVTIGDSKYLETSYAIDEKEFDKWKLNISKYASQPANLLLPIKTEFRRTAMCGHTGTATVTYVSPRSIISTTPTSSLKKYMIDTAKKLNLQK